MQYIKTDQFIIRDVRQNDISFLFSWWIDRTLNKHDPRPLPIDSKSLTEECVRYCTMFDREIMNPDPSLNVYTYYIITNIEDEPIGFINTFSYNPEHTDAELGIYIGDKAYWKRGIAKEALRYILQMHFTDKGFERIHVETGSSNQASLRLFKGLGFIECGEYIEEEDFKYKVLEIKPQHLKGV